MCKRFFTDAILRITTNNKQVALAIKDKKSDKDFVTCFTMQQTDISYEGYFFLSAYSGKAINNYHYVHSIKIIDLDN